jgi:CheY-like chemotaxis protein
MSPALHGYVESPGPSQSLTSHDRLPRSLPMILVVEDEPDMRENFARILYRGPYTCVAVHDGREALAVLEREAPPDLILTDIRMPGMDGLALLRAVRQLALPIPVVVFTAYAFDATARDALAAGAVAFLAKPFTGAQLLETVRTILDRRGTGAAGPVSPAR